MIPVQDIPVLGFGSQSRFRRQGGNWGTGTGARAAGEPPFIPTSTGVALLGPTSGPSQSPNPAAALAALHDENWT